MEPLKFCQKANIFLFIGKSQNPKEVYRHDQCLQKNFHFLLKEVAEQRWQDFVQSKVASLDNSNFLQREGVKKNQLFF